MDKQINEEKLRKLAEKIGVNIKKFSTAELINGYNHELEHGTKNPKYNVTDDDPIKTIKIALVHLLEDKKYYEKLEEMEGEK